MLISEVEIAGFVDWIERYCCYDDHISSGELTSWLEISSDVVIATTWQWRIAFVVGNIRVDCRFGSIWRVSGSNVGHALAVPIR